MKRIAIIPARGGSKRIPRKNVKDFLGKPVIAYSIEAALASNLFDEVMVSTDDEEIAEVALKYGAKVPFMRSAATSDDYATTADVLVEVLNKYNDMNQSFDEACCIYATAPLIKGNRIMEAHQKMIEGNFDSSFAMVQYSYPPQRALIETEEKKVVMQYPEHAKTRSQDLSPIYHDAGQFYFFHVPTFLRTGKLWGDNTTAVVLSELEVQDLDTETDWTIAILKYQVNE